MSQNQKLLAELCEKVREKNAGMIFVTYTKDEHTFLFYISQERYIIDRLLLSPIIASFVESIPEYTWLDAGDIAGKIHEECRRMESRAEHSAKKSRIKIPDFRPPQ